MLMNLILIVMVTCFNQPMSIRVSGLAQPLLTWCPISGSNCVTNIYPGNLDNSIMDNKQGEMCLYLLDDLCAKLGVNNELSLAYWCNVEYWMHMIDNYVFVLFCSAKTKKEEDRKTLSWKVRTGVIFIFCDLKSSQA